MKTSEIARLETRVKPEVKKALRIFCAHNGLTIRQGVEIAISELCGVGKEQKKEAKHTNSD